MLPALTTTTTKLRRIAAILAALLSLGLTATRAEVVKDVAVQYVGADTVDRAVILAQVRTAVGEQLDATIIEEDIKSLYDSGHVESVRVLTEPHAGGVRVIYLVRTRATLGEVVFIGNSISGAKLRKETELEIGRPFDDTALEDARVFLQEYYQKKGFSNVGITYKVDGAQQPGFSRVTFVVDEGTKERLNKIKFYGNEAIKERTLADTMHIKEQKVFNVFKRDRGIDAAVLEEDIIRIEELYKDEGYLNARVTDVQREPVDDKVDLLIYINEGAKFSVNDVRVSGIEAVSQEAVLAGLKMQPAGIYSAKGIKEDIRGLRKYYGNNGYTNVRVMPRITSAGGTMVDIEYDVAEGVQTTVELVNISGNDTTMDKVIRRELVLNPGDVYNEDLREVSRNRLMGLGYFDSVDVSTSAGATPHHTDVNIEVREKRTGSVNFGVGFSSIDNLVGMVDVVQTNFNIRGKPKMFGGQGMTGAGQKMRVSIKYGTERKDFRADFTEPWLFDRKLRFSTGFFYSDLLFLSDDYDQTKMGIYAGLGKTLSEHSRIQGRITAERYEIDVDDDASEELMEEDGDYNRALIGLTYIWDTRDSQYLPRRGHSLSAGINGSVGDVSNVGVELRGSKYFLLPLDTVFSVTGEYRTVDGDTPIFDRKFLGGANNLRGYDFREASPESLRDENGEPLGGNTTAYFSMEYSFPIFNLKKFRGHVFYDGGVISGSSWDLGGDYFHDVGFGVDLFLLGDAPIRVDLAWPLEKDEYTDDMRVQFNMGYRF